jgi:malic enzyme
VVDAPLESRLTPHDLVATGGDRAHHRYAGRMPDLGFEPRVDSDTGERYLAVSISGAQLLKSPLLNKGTGFTLEERERFGLRGLLPDHVSTIDEQILRVRDQFDRKPSDLSKNVYLNGLLDRNETLFYRFIVDNLEELVPIIYTPTVAYACRHWSRIFRRARGIYISPRDRGHMTAALRSRAKLANPVIVVTDNERILGIGDQGAGGMGIPIGKLALYSAAAGIHPGRLIPVSLDVGTSNDELRSDPLYLGYRHERLRGDDYDAFIAEFVAAVRDTYPDALLQWEDFANRTSFRNLDTYREVLPSFNDDIQGTAAIGVAGVMAASTHLDLRLCDHRIVIVGAGSAGIGIRHLLATAMRAEGATDDDISARLFVLDSRGLIVAGRSDLTAGKQQLAVPRAVVDGWRIADDPIGLTDVVRNTHATVLIGVSGVAGVFTQQVISRMARYAERPIIMPLSNPTSHAECTPEDALWWTAGRGLVATGSPFPAVHHRNMIHQIGQANNVFVFPGVGLGALTVGAEEITDGMFLAAAGALASTVGDDLFAVGQIFPPITSVHAVSRTVARAVAEAAIAEGVAPPMADIDAALDAAHWEPVYVPYRPA